MLMPGMPPISWPMAIWSIPGMVFCEASGEALLSLAVPISMPGIALGEALFALGAPIFIPGIAFGAALFVLAPGAPISMPGIEPWGEVACRWAFLWPCFIGIAIPGMGLAGRRKARGRLGAFSCFFAIGISAPESVTDLLDGGAWRCLGAAALCRSFAIGIVMPGMEPISFWARAGVETSTASRMARDIFTGKA